MGKTLYVFSSASFRRKDNTLMIYPEHTKSIAVVRVRDVPQNRLFPFLADYFHIFAGNYNVVLKVSQA